MSLTVRISEHIAEAREMVAILPKLAALQSLDLGGCQKHCWTLGKAMAFVRDSSIEHLTLGSDSACGDVGGETEINSSIASDLTHWLTNGSGPPRTTQRHVPVGLVVVASGSHDIGPLGYGPAAQ
ncbi:Aste57867_21491 [Aphanomyces stellatus]|uniref:Aste57867_21491 protein n=1 Tax=Aphanomyces stellatus TaxID=120398 RepID=A0A485LIY5_9STRA|nr:hypothetical protein As57867_021422 [Aphanomyces stellatus]VFT98161.1 Aste57867_21491 [Aphanomyces stellatus]